MKNFFKFLSYSFLSIFFLIVIFFINLFYMKPISLDHFLNKEISLELIRSPEYMTYVGVFDRFNFILRHNEKLTIPTNSYYKKNHENKLKRLSLLKKYKQKNLTSSQKITQKIAIFDTENDIYQYEKFRYHSYLFNQISGNHLNLIEFMTDTHPLKNYNDALNYIMRVKLFGDILNANLEWLKEQKKEEIYPPKFVFDHVINQLDELVNYKENDHPLIYIFTKKLNDINIPTLDILKLKEQINEVIRSDVNPGFLLILNFMKDNYDNANIHHGVWSLPNGDEFYNLKIRSFTTTDYSPEQIHQIGLAEVYRISERMKEIFYQLGYEVDKTVGEMMNELNENSNFLYADTTDRKKIIISDYNKMLVQAEKDVKPYFERLPKSKVEIRAIPEYSEKTAAGGYYQAPSLDGSRAGVFYANLYDIKQTPTFGMRTLTFHETIPGHHLQIALNQENKELTLYRKLGYRTSAYTEGWALYAEQLAVEIGMTKNLYDELGVLQSEMFRANRLVVDTGIHFKKWSREKAMDYMKKTTGMSDTQVRVEIERYIVWPGQALSYKIGMLKILELREKAKEKMGQNFNIKSFHSIILDQGIVPLFILEEIVNEWIDDNS
ncbi:MAG: DUF885 domain-containing protein [Rhizobiales bacterium TMED94]|nr:DUF885 domain-containing protein [Rhodobiaceae bacterium]RPF87868.1 MAG: DUF885 domain-containing protein [Rhizobiales bacterium TMED94]